MKRVLSLVLVVVMLFSMAPVSFAASVKAPYTEKVTLRGSVDVLFNNSEVVMKDASGSTVLPVFFNGSHYLPIRALCELVGLNVNWDAKTKTVELSSGGSVNRQTGSVDIADTVVNATVATNFTVTLDGEVQEFVDGSGNTVYPVVYNGTTYLPLRAVATLVGLDVDWVGATKTILLSDGNAVTEPETPALPEEPVEQPPVVPEKADDGLQGTWVHDASFRIIEYTFDGYNFYRATAQGRDWDAVLYGAGTYSLEGSNLILNHTQDFNIDNMQITRAGGLSQWNLPITNATANEITINGLVYTKKTDAPAYPTYAKIADAYSPDNYKDCYEGTIIKTLTAVTGAECTGSYEGVTDFDPISKSYVAGCPRYAYDIDILECRSEHFEPYIEYLDSVGTRVGSDASSYGSNDKYQIYSNEYTYWVGFDRITVRYSSSSFTYRSWITVYIE